MRQQLHALTALQATGCIRWPIMIACHSTFSI